MQALLKRAPHYGTSNYDLGNMEQVCVLLCVPLCASVVCVGEVYSLLINEQTVVYTVVT